MQKKTFILIVISFMFGLAGLFFFLAVREDVKRLYHAKERELIAKFRQREFDKMMKLVNGNQ